MCQRNETSVGMLERSLYVTLSRAFRNDVYS